MKFPNRPAAMPSGTSGAMKSATSKNVRPRVRANHHIATSTPISPPWNDMPPCQTMNTDRGFASRRSKS